MHCESFSTVPHPTPPPRMAVVRTVTYVWFPFASWLSFCSYSLPNQTALPCFPCVQTQITIGKYSYPKRDASNDFYLGCESGLGILRIFYSCALTDYLVLKNNSLFTPPPLLPPTHTQPLTHSHSPSPPPTFFVE